MALGALAGFSGWCLLLFIVRCSGAISYRMYIPSYDAFHVPVEPKSMGGRLHIVHSVEES
jgi:hypothetical protein